MLTAVSIIGGFLFGLLGMIVNVIEKVKREHSDNIVKKVFAKEIHANIAFGILQSLGTLLAIVVYGFLPATNKGYKLNEVWKALHFKGFSVQAAINWFHTSTFSAEIAVAWVTYFLLISFFLTLLMIVKRIFIVMNSDAKELMS